MLEREQGMDVVFVNPMPDHCLKTRHWPAVLRQSDGDKSSDECTKIFINLCKSDKVGIPEIKSANPDGCGLKKSCWSLPHCFIPPREDLDKAKKKATVSVSVLLEFDPCIR